MRDGLAADAKGLFRSGVEIYPGFSASEVLIDDNNTVRGRVNAGC